MTATLERTGQLPKRPMPPEVCVVLEGSTKPLPQLTEEADQCVRIMRGLLQDIGGFGYETQLVLRREAGCLTYKKSATVRVYKQSGDFVAESTKTVREGESWTKAIQGAIDGVKQAT